MVSACVVPPSVRGEWRRAYQLQEKCHRRCKQFEHVSLQVAMSRDIKTNTAKTISSTREGQRMSEISLGIFN